jgi:hypothetical protein
MLSAADGFMFQDLATHRPDTRNLHSKFRWERFVTAIKIDKIPLFDVGRSMFDVH